MSILVINKDLGVIPCGKEETAVFELKNNNNTALTLYVNETQHDEYFQIFPNKVTVSPGEEAIFKARFVCFVQNNAYYKSFSVNDGQKDIAEFIVRFKTIGADIKQTLYKAEFYKTLNSNVIMKRYAIENLSVCPAPFHFEHNGESHPFYITPKEGVIPAQGKIVVDIKFKPSFCGLYNKKIYCILQYHEPLIFHLMAIYNPHLKAKPENLTFIEYFERKWHNNYEAYMENQNEIFLNENIDPCLERIPVNSNVMVKENVETDTDSASGNDIQCEIIPTIEKESCLSSVHEDATDEIKKPILSKYYLNINNEKSLPKALQLINVSTEQEFYYEWNNDNGKQFSIKPQRGHLKKYERVDLDVNFDGESVERLYIGRLEARIFALNIEKLDAKTSDEKELILPETLTLCMIGHTFPAGSVGWLEQCTIEPKELTLPSCVRGEMKFATFMIKRYGHLPASFYFIPPDGTLFKIKPSLGYINLSYQIFVVQFDSSNAEKGPYQEEWKVAYNAGNKYYGKITFKVYVETPDLILQNNNKYKFNTTLPMAKSSSKLVIRNPTRLTLKYEFTVPQHINWVEIPEPQGVIDPMEKAYLDIIFTPTKIKEYSDFIFFNVSSLYVPIFVTTRKMLLEGVCGDGFLVATPSVHNFGKCLYGEVQMTSFHIYNFTGVTMTYKLYVENNGLRNDNVNNYIKIKPCEGTISGKSSVQTNVKIIPRSSKCFKHVIMCQIMKSEVGDDLLKKESKPLFTLKLHCELPVFQVIDLKIEGGGPILSPDWLWRMMKINEINRVLTMALPHEEETVEFQLPQATLGTSFTIHLLLESKSSYDIACDVKKICRNHFRYSLTTVSPQDTTEGYNKLTFDPAKFILKPFERFSMRLNITFEVSGSTAYDWSLDLSQSRIINLKSTVSTIMNTDPTQTSMFSEPNMKLRPVFIGDLMPPLQLYWLYNNTASTTYYNLDNDSPKKKELISANIIECLNPNGFLPPFSTLPILFLFRPNEAKDYSLQFRLVLEEDTKVDIVLNGTGSLKYSPISEFSDNLSIPPEPLLKLDSVDVQPSIQLFTINLIPTYSDISRIFFLQNFSKDKVWAFRWHVFYLKDLIKCTVDPEEGKLGPGEKTFQTITVQTFRYPMKTTISVPCDLIDYTALEDHNNAAELKQRIVAECSDYFTINDKGLATVQVPHVPVPEAPKSHHTFIAININVVSGPYLEMKLNSMSELNPSMEVNVKFGEEVAYETDPTPRLSREAWQNVNDTLEKILWQILNSSRFDRLITKYSEEFDSATYLQILPTAEQEMNELRERLQSSLPKCMLQNVLEDIIKSILNKLSR